MTYDDNTKKQFPSSHEMMVSRVWPDWKIIKRLGRGAYGVVYEVERDDVVRSRAALKIISFPQMESDLDALRTNEGLTEPEVETYLNHVKENFVREIQIMFSFRGLQNIVSVEDYKVLPRSEGPGFDILIRMELLTSLTEYMKENRLSEEEVIRLGTEICTALEMCAKKHVIHRDVKPDNIFINSFGSFKLGDFGVARKLDNLTAGLSRRGTYNYMAPEAETGFSYDERADLYSLGLVLYRILNNNRMPFIQTEAQQVNPDERAVANIRRLKGETWPAPARGSEALQAVISKACAYSPDARYLSAQEMKKALQSLPVFQPGTARKEMREPYGPGAGSGGNEVGEDRTIALFPANPEPEEEEREKDGSKGVPAVVYEPDAGNSAALPGKAGRGNSSKPFAPPRKQKRWIFALLAIFAVGIVGIIGVLMGKASDSSPGNTTTLLNPTVKTDTPFVSIPSVVEHVTKASTAGPSVTVPAATVPAATAPQPETTAFGGEKTAAPATTGQPGTVSSAEVTEATSSAIETESVFETIYSPGDVVLFGRYDQDGNSLNGWEGIEWIVINAEDGYVDLISRYILDVVPYHKASTEVNFAKSDLIEWLNTEFLNSAFSAVEKALMLDVVISPVPNPEYPETDQGRSVSEKVVLPSLEEVLSIFPTEESLRCPGTPFAQSKGIYINRAGNSPWWTRTMGQDGSHAALIYPSGVVNYKGWDVTGAPEYDIGIRPCVRVLQDAVKGGE